MLKNHITEKQLMINSRNVCLFFCGLLLTIGVAFTRGENRAVNTFTELPDSTMDMLSDWSEVPERLQLSFVSIGRGSPASVVPSIMESESNILTGWKGGKVSAQLLLWMVEDIKKAGYSLPTLVCRTALCCIMT